MILCKREPTLCHAAKRTLMEHLSMRIATAAPTVGRTTTISLAGWTSITTQSLPPAATAEASAARPSGSRTRTISVGGCTWPLHSGPQSVGHPEYHDAVVKFHSE